MGKYKMPLIDEDKLDKANPFVENLVVPVRKFSFIRYRKTKEGDYLPEERVVDQEYTPFCKMYISADRRLKMSVLSSRSKELFMWIMYELKSGKDWLWLNKERYMDEMGIGSFTTYHTAVGQLMDEKFIAKSSVRDVYFINPDYIFHGNRVEKYKDKVEIMNKEEFDEE